jgi:hypothetical protein
MRATIPYVLAVVTASIIIFMEIVGLPLMGRFFANGWSTSTAHDEWLADASTTKIVIWSVVRTGVTIVFAAGSIFVIFLVANIIATIPFLFFYHYYRELDGNSARVAAIVFAVLVAFSGLELVFGLLTRFGSPDHLRIAAWSIAPGIASGWVFHEAIQRSKTQRWEAV